MNGQAEFNNLQEVPVQVLYRNGQGTVVPVDGPPTWEADDESLVSIEPAEDGLNAVIRSRGPVGTTNVTVTADAKLGEGTREIVAVLEVTVTESGAVSVEFVVGEPRDRTS